MTFSALQPLADRAALYVALRQDALSAELSALGEHDWDVDMSTGVLTFTSSTEPTRQLRYDARLLATLAPGPSSLMWAWAHPQGDPAGFATRLRDYGVEHDISTLTSAEVPFPAEAAGSPDWLVSAAHTIGTVAVEITGQSPYFLAPVGGGTYAVLILLDAALPAVTVASAVITVPRMLAERTLRDARSAVWDLARLAGWNLDWADAAFSAAIVSDATGTATFRFDEQARIVGVESTLTPQV